MTTAFLLAPWLAALVAGVAAWHQRRRVRFWRHLAEEWRALAAEGCACLASLDRPRAEESASNSAVPRWIQ